jgi:DamX protein
VIQEAPAVVIDEPEGKVVPLAELPTTPARTPEPLPQPVLQPEPTRTVTAEPEVVSTPVATRAPEPQPAAVATPAPKAQVTPSAPKPSVTAGSGILSWKATDYTIQLLGVSTQKAAADFIASQPNRADLTMFKTTRQGRDWFVVVAGRYGSAAQARQAITTLPAAQRESGPWPREVGVIQKEIRSAQ